MRSTRSYAEVLTQSRRIHQAVCHPRRHIGLPTNSKTFTWRPAPAIPTDSHFHLFAKCSQHTQHRQSLVSDSTSCQQSSKHTGVQVASAELPVNIVSAPWQSATTTKFKSRWSIVTRVASVSIDPEKTPDVVLQSLSHAASLEASTPDPTSTPSPESARSPGQTPDPTPVPSFDPPSDLTPELPTPDLTSDVCNILAPLNDFQCSLLTFGTESDTMNAAFACRNNARCLTFLSLRWRGVPASVIAKIPYPHLPGPSVDLVDVESFPSPGSHELDLVNCSPVPSSPHPSPQQSRHMISAKSWSHLL